MGRVVAFTITVEGDEATIRIRQNDQRDARAAASLTDKLSKALGTVLERHQGLHAHHDSAHIHGHDHDHHHHHA